jgi:hypothetical protein
MQFKLITFFVLTFFTTSTFTQENDLTSNLYESYETFKESSLNKRRVKHHELQPLIAKLVANPRFKVNKVGESIEGRDLNLISIGSGPINVLLWSQMHGDEPTATQAIFDIFNFLASDKFKAEKQDILSNLTLHFLPMLNPDGAERFQRRNALGVDINRDALRLQSPESRTLKHIRDSLDADFGFNLHDQSAYYNAERTEKPATISYLATAYNYEREINKVRAKSMQIIVFMNNIIQKYAPGQVGRYSDEFEPRAFGDNIQKWGTSLILIESGGYANDAEKQEIRKLNYVSILSAMYTIARKNYENIPIAEYEKIPENDRKLFDLKITNATYKLREKDYILDLGINRLEVDKEGNNDFWYSSRIMDQGDLSTYYGYEAFDATGYSIKPGKLYPRTLKTVSELKELDAIALLKEGYTYVRSKTIPKDMLESLLPLNVISSTFELPKLQPEVGTNPTFILEKEGQPRYAIINGFLIDLATGKSNFKNAMIYR